jgi:formamidopyrimidine-DNA glycosylase
VPELPEVERARALIEARALERRITAVDDTDTYVCRPHAPGEIAAALVGRVFVDAGRIGKSMWVQTDDGGPALGLHLGMAGRIVVDDAAAGDPADDDGAPPVWDRFTVTFEDGGQLILRDRRRLGRAVLDPDLGHLGPDALAVDRDAAPLKARIMDQSVIAGVGNLLADEALWQAGLSPVRPAGDLGTDELDRLWEAIRAAAVSAIAKGGVHTGELIPARVRGGACPRCGAELRRAAVGGRTTYWCPAEQPDAP